VSSSLESNAPRGHELVEDSEFARVQQSERFQTLRRKHRAVVFPLTALFLTWYFLYVLLAAYAQDFMSHKIAGNINVGLVMGLLQFVSTFAITAFYVSYANKHLDPVAEEIRHELEGDAR
jgi:uncharacterized membrane protein (DUF485 family)